MGWKLFGKAKGNELPPLTGASEGRPNPKSMNPGGWGVTKIPKAKW